MLAVFGCAWAFLTPPWQIPDELPHFSYVETLFEEHHVPQNKGGQAFASDVGAAFGLTNAGTTIFVPFAHPEWSSIKAARTRAALSRAPRDDGGDGFTSSALNPPAGYLFDLPAYAVFSSAPTTTTLYAMRLWNVLLLLVNAVSAWVLVGELVSRRRVVRLAGAATIGLWPEVTFITAGVNPDGMTMALWTTVFAIAARCAVRGLTVSRGLALGLAIGLAILSKSTGVALVPGALLLVAWCLWRMRTTQPRAQLARVAAATAGAIAILPLAWSIYTRLTSTGAFSQFGQVTGANAAGAGFNIRKFLSYLWQFYLPPLGFMQPIHLRYPVISDRPVLNTWLGMGTGTFGWVNVWFPPWVYWIVGWVIVGVVVCAIWGVLRRRRDGRRLGAGRWAALGFIALGALGLVAGTHWTDYAFSNIGATFAQGRYILPGVLPILALAVGAAVAAFGRRRGIAAGVWLGALGIMQLASLGLIAERWYAS